MNSPNIDSCAWFSYFPKSKHDKLLFERFSTERAPWNNRLTSPKNWPTVTSEWKRWYDQVEEAKGSLWRDIDIHDVLRLSCSTPTFDKYLVSVAAFFWTPLCNAFLFCFSATTVTLHDIFTLAGLYPDGKEINGAFLASGLLLIETNLSYSNFIKTHNPDEGPARQEEHIAFLLY